MAYDTLNYMKPGGSEWVIGGKLTYASGGYPQYTVGTGTCVSDAVTVNTVAGQVTTEAKTTAAASSITLVITNSLAAAGDLALVTMAGGTNTRNFQVTSSIVTASTITVVIKNAEPSNAFNGYFIFDFFLVKKAV